MTTLYTDLKCEACGFDANLLRACCVCSCEVPLCIDCAESLVAPGTKAYICVFDRRVQGHGSIDQRPDVDAITEAADVDTEESEVEAL